MDIMKYYLSQQQNQQIPQNQGINPINAGTLAGMEAAKKSLEMDQNERRRALGMAIMRFSDSMSRPGSPSGLAGAAMAMSPAINAYWEEENRAKQMSAALLEQQLKQEMLNRMENMKESQHADRMQIEREKMEAYGKGRPLSSGNGSEQIPGQNKLIVSSPYGNIDVSEYPEMKTTSDKNMYGKDVKNNSEVYRRLTHIQKDLVKFKKHTEKNVFAPFGSVLGKAPNIAKDYLSRSLQGVIPEEKQGKFTIDLKNENIMRRNLNAKFETLQPVLEKASKGGVPDARLMDRFHKLKVYLSEDAPIYEIESRLNELIQEVKENRDLADLSLKTGRHITHLPISEEDSESKMSQLRPLNELTPQDVSKLSTEELEEYEKLGAS